MGKKKSRPSVADATRRLQEMEQAEQPPPWVERDERTCVALERLAFAAERMATVYEASLEALANLTQFAMGQASAELLRDALKKRRRD